MLQLRVFLESCYITISKKEGFTATKKEMELNELKLKKETLEEKEEEYKELKTQVETFPAKLEKVVDEAKKTNIYIELKKNMKEKRNL